VLPGADAALGAPPSGRARDGRLRVGNETGISDAIVVRSSLLTKEKLKPGLDLRLDTQQKVAVEIIGASKRLDWAFTRVDPVPWSAIGGQQGLGIVMTDAATPSVESLGMVVDGNALAVSNIGGMKSGSADVKVDGSTYTITGEATGADMKNPMAGMITKPFTVTVNCK